MKIQGWLVERFGGLRNYEVSDLPDGLTIFYGPNGAGKSTLFAFLRQMLFGQPRPDVEGRGAILPHERGEGRLYCAGPGGVYTIARTAEQPSHLSVTRPDGGDGGEADLEYLFGGADSRMVGSLLMFNVQDLQTLPPLSSPGVRERVFPNSVGRRRRAVRRALSTIQVRLSKIARAGNDLQELLTTPVELRTRIDRSTHAATRYCQVLKAQAQARVEVDRGTRSISDLREDKAKCDALVDLWPVWQEITQARREFETIPSFDDFPADPEERLERALAARQAARRSVEQLVDQERQPQRERPPQPGNLDPASDRSRLERMDRANLNTEDLLAWRRRLKDAAEAVRDRERELQAAKQAARNLERARNEISTNQGRREPPSAAILAEETRLLHRVRATLAGLDDDQTATKRWQELISECSGALRTLETQVPRIPSAVLPPVAWFAAGLGIMAAAWRFPQGDTLGLTLLVVCSFTSAVGAAVQRSSRTRALDEGTSRRSRVSDLRSEIERGCQNLLHHQERVARLRFDISVDSVRLGLPSVPSDRQLEEREAELDEQRQQRREWDNAQAALDEPAVARHNELERQHQQALQAAQEHERHTMQEWHQWQVRAGLADEASAVGGAGEAALVEAELLQNCRRLRTQIAESERNAAEWNARARVALARIYGADESPAIGGTPLELEAARRRFSQCEEALAQLFSEAGVSDEATFRTRLAMYRRRLTLEQTILAGEMRSAERLKQEPSANAILSELPDGHVEEWRHRSARAAAELTALELSRDEALRQLRRLDAEARARSDEAADLPVLEVEQSGLATEAIETVRAWRTLAVAASLISEAQREVERESQPAVLRRASQVLSAVTFSRYERLLQSDDQHELLVLDGMSGRKSVEQLSRATVEQVFFSLRLGLAEEHAQGGTSLPLVIDDVLDRFDPKRSRAMAHEIVELGRRRQTLVFTCRPETCDLLRSLDQGANVITMQEL